MKTKIAIGDNILWMLIAAVLFIVSFHNAFSQTNQNDIIKVKISGNGYSDESFIRFKDGASTGLEWDNDAVKMFSLNPAVPMIYTKTGSTALSLNTYPALVEKVTMDLFTKITVAGNYTIETKIIAPFSSKVRIMLVDCISGSVQNIASDSNLVAALSADSGNVARFKLYFSTASMVGSTGLTCYKNRDGKILFDNLNAEGWNIEAMDENNVYDSSFSGASSSFEIPHLFGGNYSINVLNKNDISETFALNVPQPFPVLSIFEASAETVCLCDFANVDFHNSSPGATGFAWDFGDGKNSADRDPSHTYLSKGDYLVSLKVTDGQCQDTSYSQIHVIENYILSSENLQAGMEGIKVYFDGTNYIVNTNFQEPRNINIDVYNALGQRIYSVKNVCAFKQNIKIDCREGLKPFIFSIYNYESEISKVIL